MPIWDYCSICRVLYITCNVTALCCGHLFHQDCLRQWFHTALRQSCPQCRTEMGSQGIVQKLFFELVEEEEATLDPEQLKNEIDRANACLPMKEKVIAELLKVTCLLQGEVNVKKAGMDALQKDLRDMEKSYSGLEEQMRLLYEEQREKKSAMDKTISPAISVSPAPIGYQRPKLRRPGTFLQKTFCSSTVSKEATSPAVPAPTGF